MAGQVVQMDYPVVQSVAKTFKQQADIVKAIGLAGFAIFAALEASNFWCPPLSKYYGMCKDAVKKKSEELHKTLLEFESDLGIAIKEHVDGDFEGKSYFGKG